jgi:ubiquitin carboxyl-terminal hydrolase 5/13
MSLGAPCNTAQDDPEGLDVCFQCFNGGCAGDRMHAKMHNAIFSHPLALNIRRTRKPVERDEPPPKMSKLAIAAETEADRYDTNLRVKCFSCDSVQEIKAADPKLQALAKDIMAANTFSRKEEVKAWEQELTSCEHILMLRQQDEKSDSAIHLGHCANCELKENLWLCLECGNLGCGRAQFGGIGGNSHALAHSKESGHGVAVKLGSITPEGTADVYCYSCDEERIDEDLGPHLAHWGIILADRQKTEKSLTELQIEQNMKWEFSMTAEDGTELKPVFGPGFTGLKNLGNSCYLASILQCLYDTRPFRQRYFENIMELPITQEPAEDLETQLCKMGDGLLSGRYSKPDSDVTVSEHSAEIPYQKGLAPSMLKHLIGRGHAEFSTMRQQDAFELLQHLFKLITRSKHEIPRRDPTIDFRFVMEQRLQCKTCHKVRYTGTEQDSLFIDVPLNKKPNADGTDGNSYEPVTLKHCLDTICGVEEVELTCEACGSRDGYTKQTLFKTFPEVLVINARKMAIVNWVPIKVDVPVIIKDDYVSLDTYLSPGQRDGEELLPATAQSAAPAFTANADALEMLEQMGIPRNRAEKALHATGNADVESAMNWVFEHADDADIDAPLNLSGRAQPLVTDDPGKIASLGDMGFAPTQAKKALRETDGNVERAVEWLFSHPDDQGVDDDGAQGGDASAAAQRGLAGDGTLPASFKLQSLVCHKGTSIHAGYVTLCHHSFAHC